MNARVKEKKKRNNRKTKERKEKKERKRKQKIVTYWTLKENSLGQERGHNI